MLTSTAPPRADVPPWRRRVGLLRQDPGLFPHLSVRANLTYGPGADSHGPELGRAGRPAGHRGPARRDARPAVRRPAAPGRTRPPAAGPVRRSSPGRAVRRARRQPPPRPHRPGPGPGRGPPGPVRAGGPRAGGGAGLRRPAGGPGPRRDPAGRRTRRGGPPPGLTARRRTGRLPGLRPGHRIPRPGPSGVHVLPGLDTEGRAAGPLSGDDGGGEAAVAPVAAGGRARRGASIGIVAGIIPSASFPAPSPARLATGPLTVVRPSGAGWEAAAHRGWPAGSPAACPTARNRTTASSRSPPWTRRCSALTAPPLARPRRRGAGQRREPRR